MTDFLTGTVTLLFTDIEGSTRLLHHLGGNYASVLAEHRALLRAAFTAHGGHEVDTQGDSFFVAFADAESAIEAAVAAQRALHQHFWPEGGAVRVRMAIHTGQPQRTSGGYVGVDVHRGARLMAAGHGGQILVSQTTRDAIENSLPAGVEWHNLGLHHLKDMVSPENIFQFAIAGLETDFAPLKTIDLRPNNLPAAMTPLIGRSKEIANAQELLGRPEVRLLTLTGMGGTGKTRLGLEVARAQLGNFEDGVFFVALAAVNDSSLVAANIAQILALHEATDQPLLQTLKDFLKNKRLLLVLDNFEHILEGATVVAELLAACPKLKVLATSRTRLHLRGEYELSVPLLAVPDLLHLPFPHELSQVAAVELFVQRAQAVKPNFRLDSEAALPVAAICVHLDGLPLAIDLAAARIKILSPPAILARMGQSLRFLTGGAADLPARHQTLRNTFAWSHDLLDESEKRLFRRLAIFQDGCTLEAIEAIEEDENKDVLDGMSSLCDKSFLRQQEDATGEIRFSMLETLHEFGLEKLHQVGENNSLRQAHAAWFLGLAQRAFPFFESKAEAVWLRRLEAEAGNFRAIFDWCAASDDSVSRRMELELAAVLWWLWLRRGQWSEGRARLEGVLTRHQELDGETNRQALAWTRYGAGVLAYRHAQRGTARTHFKAALELWKTEDSVQRARTLNWLGIAHMREESIARTYFEAALEIARAADDADTLSRIIHNFGVLSYEQHDFSRARSLFEEALELDESLKREGFYTRIRLGDIALWEGDFDRAAAHYQRVLDLQEPGADTFLRAYVLDSLGNAARLKSDWPRALAYHEESLQLFRSMGNLHNTAASLHALAQVALGQDQPQLARQFLNESWNIPETPTPLSWAVCVLGLATLHDFSGDADSVARCLGAIDAALEQLDQLLDTMPHHDVVRLTNRAIDRLGAELFERVRQEGRSLSLPQIMSEANAL